MVADRGTHRRGIFVRQGFLATHPCEADGLSFAPKISNVCKTDTGSGRESERYPGSRRLLQGRATRRHEEGVASRDFHTVRWASSSQVTLHGCVNLWLGRQSFGNKCLEHLLQDLLV